MDRRGGKKKLLALAPEVLARYAAGELTTPDVARLYGVSASVALRELRRHGADTSMSTRKRLRDARRRPLWERAVALYWGGLSFDEVAARVGMSASGVRRIVAREDSPNG